MIITVSPFVEKYAIVPKKDEAFFLLPTVFLQKNRKNEKNLLTHFYLCDIFTI